MTTLRLIPFVLMASCIAAEAERIPAEPGKAAGVHDAVILHPAPERAAIAPGPATSPETLAIAGALRRRLTFASSRRDGGPGYQVRHCRRAFRGCAERLLAFAAWFVEAGTKNGIDPWLLAAMAMKETSLNPYAVGKGGERGILQIHPNNQKAHNLRWMSDEWHRERCRHKVGACQHEIIAAAAYLISRALDTCGTEERALSAYNSGRCKPWNSYPRRVQRERERLLALAKEDW